MAERRCEKCDRPIGDEEAYQEDFFGGVICPDCLEAVGLDEEEDERDD